MATPARLVQAGISLICTDYNRLEIKGVGCTSPTPVVELPTIFMHPALLPDKSVSLYREKIKAKRDDKKSLLILIGLLLGVMAEAQGWRANEMEIKVTFGPGNEAMQLHGLKLNGDFYQQHAVLYVIPEEVELIKASGVKYEILIENLNEHYKDFWETRNAYHRYQEIIDLADSLAGNFPDICTKHIFGTSMGGRQLAALKISDNSAIDENEAEIMFDGRVGMSRYNNNGVDLNRDWGYM